MWHRAGARCVVVRSYARGAPAADDTLRRLEQYDIRVHARCTHDSSAVHTRHTLQRPRGIRYRWARCPTCTSCADSNSSNRCARPRPSRGCHRAQTAAAAPAALSTDDSSRPTACAPITFTVSSAVTFRSTRSV